MVGGLTRTGGLKRAPLPTILSVGNNLAALGDGQNDSDAVPQPDGFVKASSEATLNNDALSEPWEALEWSSDGDSVINEWKRGTSVSSRASSGWQYADPSQMLLFLDWDDTLFPTTDLLDRWEVPLWQWHVHPSFPMHLDRKLMSLLESWRVAVSQYLQTACAHSDRVVIVTNASRPWVDACVDRFAPELRQLFQKHLNKLKVVYADEALLAAERRRAEGPSQGAGCRSCVAGLKKWWDSHSEEDEGSSRAQRKARLTAAKHAAMKHEADGFYSRYPGQTWKNILSIGDMRYEYDAVHELSAGRVFAPARERLRTKAIVVPGSPPVGQLTLQLRINRVLLPGIIHYDGHVQLDLGACTDPLEAIGDALGLHHLATIHFPGYAWGRGQEPESEEAVTEALDEVEEVIAEALAVGHEHGPGHARCPGALTDIR